MPSWRDASGGMTANQQMDIFVSLLNMAAPDRLY
jgi:hypothetical protein